MSVDKVYHEVKKCRVCENENLIPVLSLGNQYVVNFPDGTDPEDGIRAPLDMVLCGNTDCSLAQLRHSVNPDLMYRKYWYKSGINQTMRDALSDITSAVESMIELQQGDIVVDIGANDGTLLRSYNVSGLFKVAFEPATNLMDETRQGTSLVINDYFNAKAFKDNLADKKAKVVTSIAMFYDLEDPNSFVDDIRSILDQDGIWTIQMNYLGTMLSKNAFDNISHEHLEYYSLSSLDYLLSRHDMEVVDLELNDLNGGSIRTYVAHKGSRPVHHRVDEMRTAEKHLKTFDPYQKFVMRVEEIKRKLTDFIRAEHTAGKKIYVYGASTRGNTLLQYFNLNNELITAAAERNPVKYGKRMVGTNIPIISEDEARKAKPNYFLALPWAFIREFVQREEDFLKDGGSFIVPLSKFEIISKTNNLP